MGKFERTPDTPKKPGWKLAIPFFLAMTILTAVSFIIPLRPTQSYTEKRNLAEFPEFSLEALTSGSYFDDISTWFSDTFPGRESWIQFNSSIQMFHGTSDISIQGTLESGDEIPVITESTEETETSEATEAPTETTVATEATEETVEETTEYTEPIVTTPPTTPIEEWGGVDAGEGAEINMGTVIQIGDMAFNFSPFSQMGSDRYTRMSNTCAETLSDNDVNIVISPIPTSIGIMVEPEYLERFHCDNPDDIIQYMFSGMSDDLIKVNLYQTLVDHNDEYIYFAGDHHWTGLGAYYGYVEICNALGIEPAALESFEEFDLGLFRGSIYWKATHSYKLKDDYVIAYQPPGEVSMMIHTTDGYAYEWPVLTDLTKSNEGSKYMTFLGGDQAMCVITNESIPDAPNCVIVKDSYGNAMAPFFSQNYHTVYVIDYRKYTAMKLDQLVEVYDISDVIFLNNITAAQDKTTNDILDRLVS